MNHVRTLFDPPITRRVVRDALGRLDPRRQLTNPVMFVVWAGALITAAHLAGDLVADRPFGFNLQITLWLWFTVLFANFAEAMAEGRGKARITSEQGSTLPDCVAAPVEGTKRQKTPNEIALTLWLAGPTVIYLLAVLSLHPLAAYSAAGAGTPSVVTVSILIVLLVCLIPTTIGRLLDASDSSHMDHRIDRMAQRNVPATGGRAVEATRRAGCRDQGRVLHRGADVGAHHDGVFAVQRMMAGRRSSARTMRMRGGRQ